MRRLNRLKIIATVTAVVLCMTALSACRRSDDGKVPEGAISIYCTDKNRTEVVWEYYKLVQKPGNAQITEVIKRFAQEPSDSSRLSAMPGNIRIESYYFGEGGQLVLLFNDEYGKLDRISEILLRTCLVKTLCQLGNVEGVEFYVGGNPLMLKDGQPAGIMADNDFIDNTGGTSEFWQSVNITVYFSDETGTMLKESRLIVESNGTKSQAQIALEQLIAGPLEVQTDLYPVIPADTGLNRVNVRDGIAYVDLSREFLNSMDGVSDELVVYSVVNTLAELPNIFKVSFSIDGQVVKAYGEIPLDGMFERRPELIVTEKAGDVTE